MDVDIITEESFEKVKETLNEIVENQDIFTKVEENIRENVTSKRMTIEHYKFYFNSIIDDTEKFILLDIAYESNKYASIVERKIKNSKLNVNSDYKVIVPTVESILGDKLTVLAPNTTGIGYNSNKELELMKQLYDVGNLFNRSENIEDIRKSFINIANREIRYRKLYEVTYEDVLDDIENFTKDIIFQKDKEHLKKVNSGISKIRNFILEKKFLIDIEALTAAAKVNYLVYCIRNNVEIEKYNDSTKQELLIKFTTNKRLKVIRSLNPEAYYYLKMTLE